MEHEITAFLGIDHMARVMDIRTDDWIELETMMSDVISSTVSIKTEGRKGKAQFNVHIKCASSDELNALLTKLKRVESASSPT